MRLIWGTVGFIALGLGLVGAVLPIVPTVPFLLVATFCFARSSPRFYRWLMRHPVFGAQIRNWRKHGAISTRAKALATLSMAASVVLGFFMLPLPIWGVQIAILLVAAGVVVTRPAPPLPRVSVGRN